MVMIDCYTSWCGPCKMMAAKEFPKKEMGDYLNPKSVCMKMDMEKGEGPDVSKRYKNGDRSKAFIKEYIDELCANMMQGEINKVVSDYLKRKSAADLVAYKENFDMFCNHIDQLDDPLFQTMYADKEVLIAKY